jgi:hypothetical protein
MTLEEKLETLKKYGIELYPHTTVDDLRSKYGCSDDTPYKQLINDMAVNNLSGDLWWTDLEEIDNEGAYVAIALKTQEITDGLLTLSDVEDFIDWENGVGSLSFTFNGQRYKWDLEVNGDWADATIFERFADLIAQQGTDKKIVSIMLDVDAVFMFASDEQVKQLRAEIGVEDF